MEFLNFRRMTETEYNELPEKNPDTLYILSDKQNAFRLGDSPAGGGESVTNKVTSISSSSTDEQYPSAKCVYDNLSGKAGVSHTHTMDDITGLGAALDAKIGKAIVFSAPNGITSIELNDSNTINYFKLGKISRLSITAAKNDPDCNTFIRFEATGWQGITIGSNLVWIGDAIQIENGKVYVIETLGKYVSCKAVETTHIAEDWYLPGSMNGWSFSDSNKLSYNSVTDRYELRINLDVNTSGGYEFKLVDGNGWEGHVAYGSSGTMSRGNSTDWILYTDQGNVHILTDVAGEYLFSWDVRDASNRKLTVTYPPQS